MERWGPLRIPTYSELVNGRSRVGGALPRGEKNWGGHPIHLEKKRVVKGRVFQGDQLFHPQSGAKS